MLNATDAPSRPARLPLLSDAALPGAAKSGAMTVKKNR
jgi:hypothetical protein